MLRSGWALYRATTDANGLAQFEAPKGNYALDVWKAGYVAPSVGVEVNEGISIDVEAVPVPKEEIRTQLG